jgi:hypothetical protein
MFKHKLSSISYHDSSNTCHMGFPIFYEIWAPILQGTLCFYKYIWFGPGNSATLGNAQELSRNHALIVKDVCIGIWRWKNYNGQGWGYITINGWPAQQTRKLFTVDVEPPYTAQSYPMWWMMDPSFPFSSIRNLCNINKWSFPFTSAQKGSSNSNQSLPCQAHSIGKHLYSIIDSPRD